MKCPMTSVWCFCIQLRTTLLIYGYVSLIISLLFLPVFMFLAVNDDVTNEVLMKLKENMHWEKIHFQVDIIFSVIDAALTACLLRGMHKEIKNLLRIYQYGALVFLPISLVTHIFWLIPAAGVSSNFYYYCTKGITLYTMFLVYNYINKKEDESSAMGFKNQNV